MSKRFFLLLLSAIILPAQSTVHILCDGSGPAIIELQNCKPMTQYLITNRGVQAVPVEAPKHQKIGKCRLAFVPAGQTICIRYQGHGRWSYTNQGSN